MNCDAFFDMHFLKHPCTRKVTAPHRVHLPQVSRSLGPVPSRAKAFASGSCTSNPAMNDCAATNFTTAVYWWVVCRPVVQVRDHQDAVRIALQHSRAKERKEGTGEESVVFLPASSSFPVVGMHVSVRRGCNSRIVLRFQQ